MLLSGLTLLSGPILLNGLLLNDPLHSGPMLNNLQFWCKDTIMTLITFALMLQELLVDPVVAADGHTYERHEITEWLKTKDSSPMTNERMEHKYLIPNLALRAIMDAYFGC